jgi:hypothetical protein
MIYLVRNDVGSQISATITREDNGLPVDLRLSTQRLRFRKAGTTAVLFTLTGENLGESAELQGICVFTFSGANLEVDAGRYEGEIEVSFADANIETVYETVQFIVRDDF